MNLILFLVPLFLLPVLVACLPVPGLFYIGELSEHDQALFREAARIEDVDTVDWHAPGAWVVIYGSPYDQEGGTAPYSIWLKRSQDSDVDCPRDQQFLVNSRHEIRHTEGQWHSSDPASVMHYPAPCWPEN